MVFVQFSDDKETKIVSSFASPQEDGIYDNYGEVEESDPRYISYLKIPGWIALQGRAFAALRDSDTVLMSYFSDGKTPPPEWSAYRQELKKILNTLEGDPDMDLPSKPSE